MRGSSQLGAKSPTARRTSRERGASEAFMLILMVSILGFAGVVYDTGMAFNTRREATNIAASAARAGANAVTTDTLYENSNDPFLTDEALGVAIDAAYGAGAEHAAAELQEDDELHVTVEMTHHNVILGLFGIADYTVTGEATATLESRDS